MTDLSERFAQELDELRGLRDELRLQVHLGKQEVKERWEDLEKRFEHLEGKAKLLKEESKEPLQEIGEAARNLVKEIRDGYQHLKSLI